MSDAQINAGGEAEDTVREPGTLQGRRNWLSVARKEIADAGRSWQLYILTGGFLAILTLGSMSKIERGSRPQPADNQFEMTFREGLQTLAGFIEVLVPLVILIGLHTAIAKERERGSLRVILTLPVSRWDVLAGTALGRAVVIAGTFLAALAVNGLTMWVLYDSMDLLTYGKFAFAVVTLGIVFVGIAVGISAVARTTNRSVSIAIGVFLVVTLMWEKLLGAVDLVTGVQPQFNPMAQDVAPGWRVFLYRIRPGEAWQLVVTDWIAPVMPELGRGENTYYARYTTPGPEPFYLDSWFLAIVLILWCIVPLLVGYWRFREADIG
ncbi:hypothetical protein BRC81_14705 [Halobacteriales archaeon QS_1_68_20]|nr:MAG: hypothetical protein BRC81_14705 [Halobacteriales archaeon QS_1_68_20]